MLALQGCATSTSASDPSMTHNRVPTDRVVEIPPIKDLATASTVHIMRDAQIKGSAMTTTVTIDGQDAAHVENGEKLTFKIDAGEHLIGLKFLGNDPVMGWLTLGIARPKRFSETATRFEPGREYFFRIVDNANWEWELRRSSY